VGEALRAKGLKDDLALSELLLNNGDVAVVPGSAFGAPGYLRLSFACSLEALQEAIRRISRVVG
jgi:aspartate aminotransferase